MAVWKGFNERNIGDDKRFGDLTERVPPDSRRTQSNSDDEFKRKRDDYKRREKDLSGNTVQFEVGFETRTLEDEVTVNALVYFCQDDDVCLSRTVSFRAKVVDGGDASSSSSSSSLSWRTRFQRLNPRCRLWCHSLNSTEIKYFRKSAMRIVCM